MGSKIINGTRQFDTAHIVPTCRLKTEYLHFHILLGMNPDLQARSLREPASSLHISMIWIAPSEKTLTTPRYDPILLRPRHTATFSR